MNPQSDDILRRQAVYVHPFSPLTGGYIAIPILPLPHVCLLYLHRLRRLVNKVISYHELLHDNLHKALPDNANIQVHARQ